MSGHEAGRLEMPPSVSGWGQRAAGKQTAAIALGRPDAKAGVKPQLPAPQNTVWRGQESGISKQSAEDTVNGRRRRWMCYAQASVMVRLGASRGLLQAAWCSAARLGRAGGSARTLEPALTRHRLLLSCAAPPSGHQHRPPAPLRP